LSANIDLSIGRIMRYPNLICTFTPTRNKARFFVCCLFFFFFSEFGCFKCRSSFRNRGKRRSVEWEPFPIRPKLNWQMKNSHWSKCPDSYSMEATQNKKQICVSYYRLVEIKQAEKKKKWKKKEYQITLRLAIWALLSGLRFSTKEK
jgi:hypothetical protein